MRLMVLNIVEKIKETVLQLHRMLVMKGNLGVKSISGGDPSALSVLLVNAKST
jgi:hypothetical protein